MRLQTTADDAGSIGHGHASDGGAVTPVASIDSGNAAQAHHDAGTLGHADAGMSPEVMSDGGSHQSIPDVDSGSQSQTDVDSGVDSLWIEDALLADQWHLFRGDNDATPGAGHISADKAWDFQRGNPNVVVAVIDTGTDMNHPDLAPNIVGGLDAIAGDDDPDAQCSSSWDGRDVDSSCPEDRPFFESHGTSVSGLVASVGMNEIGTSGVCPECSLYPVRMIGGGGFGDSLSNALTFRSVVEAADIINNSWGPVFPDFSRYPSSEIAAFTFAETAAETGWVP